jgi:hypothetical protein
MALQKQHIILFFILLIAFSFSLWRDSKIENHYTSDLRNRVVGARLEKDSKLPYFYKWKEVDGLRYYDPIAFDTTYTNAITASPFFHQLLYPISDLPQRQISKIWLGVEYTSLLICMIIAFSFTKTIQQQWAVTIISIMVLFSSSWLLMINVGQIYILYPMMAFLFLYFIKKKKKLPFAFLAGLSVIILILMRPTMLLFFLLFLFFVKNYSIKYLTIFFLPILLLLGYSVLNTQQRNLWLDYRKAIQAHIKDHQSDDRQKRTRAYNPVIYKQWEGWDQDSIDYLNRTQPLRFNLECGSVQNLAKSLFDVKISTLALNISLVATLIFLFGFFYFVQKNKPDIEIEQAAIFGFCLYMISDLFSPILRILYYDVQWVFPLLLFAAYYNKKNKLIFLLLGVGLFLNILNTRYIPYRHSIGAIMILATLLWFCLHPKTRLTT